MKRIYLIILVAAMTLSGMAQSVGEAFYIYRNDGQFNAFFRDEVISIEYSQEDADGNHYDEIVTQIVNTADSVYKIPLAAIDSIGFATPKTVYQPGVKRIEGDLRSYVLSVESLTIHFNSNTPANVLPHVGDRLVTTEMSDVFPIGFAGEVVNVIQAAGSIDVVCTAVSLEDVFIYYYGITESEWKTRQVAQWNSPINNRASGTYAPGKLTCTLLNDFGFTNSYVPNDELSFDLSTLKADISVTPVVNGHIFVIVNPFYGVNVSLTITGSYDAEENFALCGGISWKKDFELVRLPWPIAPLVDVYLSLGGFLQAEGEFAIDKKWTQQFRSVFHWDYSSKGTEDLKPLCKTIPVSSGDSGEASIKGNIGAGIYLEVGFDFIHTKKLDIANVNLRAEAGVNLEGNLILTKSDMETAKTSTVIYESLRDTELSLNWFYGVTANAQILKWGVSRDVNLANLPLNNQGKIFTCAMAPSFSDVEIDWSDSDPSALAAEAQVSCPAWLGGRCIISDVGLVLKDADGDDVSRAYLLNGYNGSQGKTNIRKVFTNVTKGDVYKVYPFIKWMGCELLASPYAEVKNETSCPDENHPHMIDLGLPSGTKWACCNVGASNPEDYGGYYAWGETSEKECCNVHNYKYAIDDNEHGIWFDEITGNYKRVIDIGSDIAGTQYDVAYVTWGAEWRMPSKSQFDELINNSYIKWDTHGGLTFMGLNGNSIHFPDAGCSSENGASGGGWGHYWSSSATMDSYNQWAYLIRFWQSWEDILKSLYGPRYMGFSVRPVSNN